MRKYYEAYDDRYRQVHAEKLHWFGQQHSAIVSEILEKYAVAKNARILEVGCGEGRDARFLLNQGFHVLATDVSPAAVDYCKSVHPEFQESYAPLDCLNCQWDEEFDFIYAVAVVHMLVPDDDRQRFYSFYRDHLAQGGIGLICTMGDGTEERKTDISTAFSTRQRLHKYSGKTLTIANTSCRMVTFEQFEEEILRSGLQIRETGITAVEPDFPQMMYAVVTV